MRFLFFPGLAFLSGIGMTLIFQDMYNVLITRRKIELSKGILLNPLQMRNHGYN